MGASGPLSVLARAKLTLSLRITGVRADGFHLLDAEMVTLDLADVVTFAEGDGLTVHRYNAHHYIVSETLDADGTWLIVEPFAGDRVEDNLNPVGRIYYAASTMICVPASLSQEVGAALGAQAGEARLRQVITAGGFRQCRRATATPFNLVLEARP